MKTLIEAIDCVKENYRQEFSKANSIFSALFKSGPLPKFLYRGEAQIWEKTESTATRKRLKDDPDFAEINYWVTGRNNISGTVQNIYSLYHFMRESLYGISVVDESLCDPNIDKQIGGLLQHYGFDTSVIDLTSEIETAAFLASSDSKVGTIGQIFVMPTINIEEYIFDLSVDKAARPKKQKAFALVLPYGYDLKAKNLVSFKNGYSIKFKLTANDKERYQSKELLSVIDDDVVEYLLDWFECHISINQQVSDQVKTYFTDKIDILKQHYG